MTTLSIAVIAFDCGPGLLETLDAVKRQTRAPLEVVVAYRSAAGDLPPMLRAIAGRPTLSLVTAEDGTAAAMKNAAIRAARGDLVSWIDEGDLLDPRFCAAGADALQRERTAFAASIVGRAVRSGESPGTATLMAPAITLADLLRTSTRTPVAPIVQKVVWEQLGGFDEALSSFDDYDFWLRALESGCAGTTVPVPLVTRVIRRRASGENAWEPAASSDAIHAVVRKHLQLFQRDPAAALVARERILGDLVDRHASSISRRDALLSELEANKVEEERLTIFLQDHGREAVEWGDLRETAPLSHEWGYDRGKPVDRYYIEQFLQEQAFDIAGTVLEVQEADFTRRFGGSRVERSDVVDINTTNPGATVIADLRDASVIPSNTYDCFILTQTLHVIDDMPAVLRECRRILKPGGVLLVTLPCASRVCLEYGPDGDFWRMTEAGARSLFSQMFPADHLHVRTFGNVLASTAFFYGLATHEISKHEFDAHDPYNPTVIGVRAVKPAQDAALDVVTASNAPAVRSHVAPRPGVVLLYHRIGTPDSDVHGLAVPPPVFRTQMQLLERRRPMALQDLVAAAEHGDVPEGAIAVTFDDGYLDNLEVAVPILISLGIPATFFMTTQALYGRDEYWWDTLERVLLRGRTLPTGLDISIGADRLQLSTSTIDERQAANARLHRALVEANLETRDRCIRSLLAWAGADVPPRTAPIMTAAQMQQLAQLPGCSVGAHSMHHLGLPAQPAMVVGREVAQSKRDLERLIGSPISTFAYPYGYFDDETVEAVRRAGYKQAFTCEARFLNGENNLLRLPRMEVKAWTAEDLGRRLELLAVS